MHAKSRSPRNINIFILNVNERTDLLRAFSYFLKNLRKYILYVLAVGFKKTLAPVSIAPFRLS